MSSLSAAERRTLIWQLTEQQADDLLRDWRFWARPEQLPPPGDWRVWLFLAGRGAGKTRAAVEWTIDGARRFPLVNVCGPTADDARDIMIEGESGILACAPPGFRPAYLPSKRRLEWPNGARTLVFTADEPERLRGKQHMRFWGDELASWRHPEAFDQAMFGLRLGADPRAMFTGTPKPVALIRDLVAQADDPTGRVVLTRATTYANRGNLAPAFFDQIVRRYEGSRLGRQELLGELLEDVEGALWRLDLIDAHRLAAVPEGVRLVRVVVAVDPPVAAAGAECGIVVVAFGSDRRGYVLADRSRRGSPNEWATTAVAAFDAFAADAVVIEVNQGGDMATNTLRTVRPNLPVVPVHASRGKATRAEPIAALYEQGHVSHVGSFPALEDQLTQWVPGEESPDRLDALVWGATEALAPLLAPPVRAHQFDTLGLARAAADPRRRRR